MDSFQFQERKEGLVERKKAAATGGGRGSCSFYAEVVAASVDLIFAPAITE